MTHWYDAGLSTTVGSSAYVSIYNPTATAAVLNASIFTASGVSMPDAFQGLSIPAHTESEIKLASEVVNTSNIGVAIDVLRGSLEIVGAQDSSGVLSLNAGTTQTATNAWYPNVTTANKASATLLFANPGADAATVTVDVAPRFVQGSLTERHHCALRRRFAFDYAELGDSGRRIREPPRAFGSADRHLTRDRNVRGHGA